MIKSFKKEKKNEITVPVKPKAIVLGKEAIQRKKKRIFIGTDHAGFELKNKLVPYLESLNYEVWDCGSYKYDEFDDYPDFIAPVAQAVSDDPEKTKGIVIGGSGQGEAMLANKFPHVRAVVFYGYRLLTKRKEDIVNLSRLHNNANILSLGARFVGLEEAKKAVAEWLETDFSGEYKHVRRLKKMDKVAREVRLRSHF